MSVDQFPYAHGGLVVTAKVRSCPEDFQVYEDLGFEPTGEGQHRMIEIEKRDLNSDWVASQIAQLTGVKKRDVGMAGLKDRYAVTRQWFSVDSAGKEDPEWKSLEGVVHEGQRLSVLQVQPHNRKIRRGALQGNRFQLLLRDLEGDNSDVEARLTQIQQHGVPNYFGEQRFGRGGGNVDKGLEMFRREYRPRSRHERGMLLSAVRSEIFNRVCAARIEQGSWDQALLGDIFALDRSRASFQSEEIDEEILRRIAEHDIHPSGPLWGRGDLGTGHEVAQLEQTIVTELEELRLGLEQAGLEQDRRALRLVPQEMRWEWVEPSQLQLNFWLPAGSYATVILRELLDY